MEQRSLFDAAPAAPRTAMANIDGGSRGNPGPAGFGVYITLPGGATTELKGALPHCTNNVAEYKGLLAALQWAVDHGVSTLHVRADSELLVKQMRGEYRVRNAGLLPLFEEARRLARRELNTEADRLANEAMDEAAQSGVPK